ncbi:MULTISPECIES: hypothetical protein [unclassified Aureispira]|uniref:hypothetical protein n=1 Tax=unclassified Aureispira TaxID=2649989 RepID=UPI0006983672|nr:MULTISPECIES: hypothetical protein [unclassified Aureispira]WMX17506.1 hypothetical protein QP953_14085 [Aureispira sp. CCB-E]
MEQNQKLYLFQLIKSLSVSEKGYVKKFCAKNGANPSYLKLFDAIDLQTTYNEESIKKKFKNQKFVKQLSVAKNYLIKSILRSLRAYHSESTNNIQVHELLLEIEILYNKRLIGLCQKLIKKTRRIIEEAQLYHHAEELAFWDFRLALLLPSSHQIDAHMEANKAFANKGLQATSVLSEYRHLAYDVFKFGIKEGYSREEKAKTMAQEFSEHHLLKNLPDSNNAKAVARYHNIWNKIHEINTDFEQGYESSKGFVKVIQENPKVFEDYLMSTVVPAHYNLLGCCILLNKEATFYPNLQYLKDIPKTYKSKNETIHRLTHYYAVSLELQFYTQNAYFDKTPALLPEAVKIVEEGNLIAFGLILFHIELCYSIAYAYFALGDYEASETWVNRTLEHQKDNLREDIMCMAHLLHLVNHAEMGSIQYLDYKLRSTYNFIKRMEKIHKFEKVTLQFLKKLINVKNSTEFITLIKVYKEKFEAIEHLPFERIIIKNFDIISWMESKLQHKKFLTVAASRRSKNSM